MDKAELQAAVALMIKDLEQEREAIFRHAAWRWHFDRSTGPLIGGAVIFGTLALAALAAYMGG